MFRYDNYFYYKGVRPKNTPDVDLLILPDVVQFPEFIREALGDDHRGIPVYNARYLWAHK